MQLWTLRKITFDIKMYFLEWVVRYKDFIQGANADDAIMSKTGVGSADWAIDASAIEGSIPTDDISGVDAAVGCGPAADVTSLEGISDTVMVSDADIVAVGAIESATDADGSMLLADGAVETKEM